MSVAGAESALQEYRAVVLGHPRLREAVRGVRSSLAPGLSPQIVALVGPTGVGKSTVLEVVGRELAAEASTVRTAGEHVPAAVVKVVCLPPGNKGFEFGQFHWRLLSQAVGGECPDDHICPDEEAKRLKKGGAVRQGQGTVDEQRVGVLTFLRQRGVRAVVFDEAQYVTRIRGARTQADQLDIVKDCVDRSGLPHVLAGTYELNALFSANEQAVRRLRVHHFRPYFLDVAEDREAFVQILGELLLALPLPDPGRSLRALEPHLRAICVRSLGCVGILKDWLTDGLRTVVEEGGEILDWPALNAPGCGISDGNRIVIAKTIRENRRLGQEKELKDIEQELGLASDWAAPSASGGKSGRRPKPGRRLPARDPVGLPSEHLDSDPASTGTV